MNTAKARNRYFINTRMFLRTVARRLDDAASDEEFQAICLSTMPKEALGRTRESLAHVFLHMLATFTVTTTPRYSCWHDRLRLCLANRKGELFEVATVCAAGLRGAGFRARLAFPLVGRHGLRREEGTGKPRGSSARRRGDWERLRLFCFVEIFFDAERRWLPLLPLPGSILDDPRGVRAGFVDYQMESSKLDRADLEKLADLAFSHVVSVEGGILRDISRRYCAQWVEIQKKRCYPREYELAIRSLSNPSTADDCGDLADEEDFRQRSESDPVPTTLGGCKNHPAYVLEKDLNMNQVLHPRPTEPVGLVSGHPVFRRSAVQTLYSSHQWIRRMRQVRIGERPFRTRTLRADAGKAEDPKELGLFGPWQTEPLMVPSATADGKVPKNALGNVELWTAQHLPLGCVHLRDEFAARAAKSLGVDFAPAMTRFEWRERRACPVFDGVIVCEQFRAKVAEQCQRLRSDHERRMKEQIERRVLRRWKMLLRRLDAMDKIERRYGHQPLSIGRHGGSSTAEAIQSRTPHQHDFEEPRAIDLTRSLWRKQCRICRIQVDFEVF